MSQIPARSYQIVLDRDQRCVRCGAGGRVFWHHRRSRRVPGQHQHCPCNGIDLCATCHDYVHAHPKTSQEAGLIVSSYIEEPASVPVKTYRGWVNHDCEGGRTPFPV